MMIYWLICCLLVDPINLLKQMLYVWCPLHQIDTVIKEKTIKLDSYNFYKMAYVFNIHL